MYSMKIRQTHTHSRIAENFYSINPKIFRYGTETGSYIAPEIWSKLPETINMSSSLQTRMCLPNIFVSLIILHFLTLPYILSFVTYVFFNFL